jgi:hypothetical protein
VGTRQTVAAPHLTFGYQVPQRSPQGVTIALKLVQFCTQPVHFRLFGANTATDALAATGKRLSATYSTENRPGQPFNLGSSTLHLRVVCFPQFLHKITHYSPITGVRSATITHSPLLQA